MAFSYIVQAIIVNYLDDSTKIRLLDDNQYTDVIELYEREYDMNFRHLKNATEIYETSYSYHPNDSDESKDYPITKDTFPKKLKILEIYLYDKFNLSFLPKDLEYLQLNRYCNNPIDTSLLPRKLIYLELFHHNLKIDFTTLPKGLKYLILGCYYDESYYYEHPVDVHNLPKSLEFVRINQINIIDKRKNKRMLKRDVKDEIRKRQRRK